MEQLVIIGTVALTGILLFILRQRLRAGGQLGLRPLAGYNSLQGQVGRAIESGSRLHVSLGQAGLTNSANPTTLAGTAILDHLASEGYRNGIPPLVTVGEGTILPIAQESLRHAYTEAGRPRGVRQETPEFVAHNTDPFVYAAGVSNVIQQQKVSSNVMVGRFGPEVAIVTETAERHHIDQVIGTDDPLALAVVIPTTENILIGEELLAAGAYLQGRSTQLASLQVQDVLRWLISLAILGLALYQFIR